MLQYWNPLDFPTIILHVFPVLPMCTTIPLFHPDLFVSIHIIIFPQYILFLQCERPNFTYVSLTLQSSTKLIRIYGRCRPFSVICSSIFLLRGYVPCWTSTSFTITRHWPSSCEIRLQFLTPSLEILNWIQTPDTRPPYSSSALWMCPASI
jgi:hypothetical protein